MIFVRNVAVLRILLQSYLSTAIAERGYTDAFTYIEGLCVYNDEDKARLHADYSYVFSKTYEYISQFACEQVSVFHDDVIKWKHFPRYWSFVWGIHWSPVNSPHKGQWRGAFMFLLIYA